MRRISVSVITSRIDILNIRRKSFYLQSARRLKYVSSEPFLDKGRYISFIRDHDSNNIQISDRSIHDKPDSEDPIHQSRSISSSWIADQAMHGQRSRYMDARNFTAPVRQKNSQDDSIRSRQSRNRFERRSSNRQANEKHAQVALHNQTTLPSAPGGRLAKVPEEIWRKTGIDSQWAIDLAHGNLPLRFHQPQRL